jgi:hypothetical protein
VAFRLTRRLRTKKSALFLVALAAVVINLPLAHSSYYGWRLDRAGVDTTATVVETRRVPPEGDGEHVVEFRFDREIDPEQREWFAQVDAGTYSRAEADGTIEVRVLPDRPQTYEAVGQEKGSLPLVITLVGDLMLLGISLLYWRTRPEGMHLRLVATADVERCKPKPVLEQLDDGSYLVCGEVSGIEDGVIVVEVGDHTVRVELDGHDNPVGYQQPARVVGRPPGGQ